MAVNLGIADLGVMSAGEANLAVPFLGVADVFSGTVAVATDWNITDVDWNALDWPFNQGETQ